MTVDTPESCKVGKGRPPLPTRLQKGNPGGRRRGSRNLRTVLHEALEKKIRVTEGGKSRRVSKRDLGIARLADKFAEGDPLALKLLALVLELDRRSPAEPTERPPLEEADQLVVENLLARFRKTLSSEVRGPAAGARDAAGEQLGR
jgi:Family of unknown function (DUF5681)